MPWARAEDSRLAEVVPPRDLEGGIAAARGMLGALAGEALSLEIAIAARGPRWYVRSKTAVGLDRALAELRAACPQARVEPVPRDRADLDPARLLAGERAVAVELHPSARDLLAIRSDWRHERSPLAGVLARAAPVGDERVVCRLELGAPPCGAAGRLRGRAAPPGRAHRDPIGHAGHPGPSPLPIAGALAIAAAVLQGREWYEGGEWAPLLASGACLFVGLPLAGARAVRLLRSPGPLPPAVVDQKLASPLAGARLEVQAIGGRGAGAGRLGALALETARAYGTYDSAAGGLRPSAPRSLRRRAGRRLPLLLNASELASLWHLPDGADGPVGARRTASRRLPPQPGHAERGARVGVSDAEGGADPVHVPAELLHRNQLIVAKTRRGKSTLLRHLAARLMEGAASGSDETALVVVDPHRDLAEAVLEAVPDELSDRTTYLDFADLERPVGLNLLDVALFPDRDRTAEHVVTMMNRLWPSNWGPRMEGALRASLLALLDANRRYEREAQFTLLDVAPLLTDRELRERVLGEVQDPAVRAWWRDNYDRVGRALQQQTATPVTSKIGRFTVTEASRLVFGQARSTFDPRGVLAHGGVLVVNTATGALGEGASSLVGATLLNLLGLLVEEQVQLAPERRRRAVVLVDESSTLGAVDYTRMLSELGKYGASFVLVTQSLSKLDAIDRNLAPAIFANSDGLTVFGVSAEDARRLTPELGGGIEVADLVSLDDFTCYARWWDGRSRPESFSFRVDPPPPTVPGRARAIAARSAARVGRPRDEVVREITRALSERVPADEAGRRGRRSREELAGEGEGLAAGADDSATAPTGKVERGEGTETVQRSRRGNGHRSPRHRGRRA